MRVAHFGDFGQRALRRRAAGALGPSTSCSCPSAAGPTIGAEQAHAIVDAVARAGVVPMHYRTQRIDFLEPPTPSRHASRASTRSRAGVEPTTLPSGDGPLLVVPAAP